MGANLIAGLTVFAVVAAVAFLITGSTLVKNIPTVQRLLRAKKELAGVPLSKAIRKGTTLDNLGMKRLAEIVTMPASGAGQARFSKRELSEVLQVVHYRERTMRHITHELRIYAFLLAMLGIVGFLSVLSKVGFTGDLSAIWQAIGDNPWQVIALFELFMLVLFVVRLVVELGAIDELLEE